MPESGQDLPHDEERVAPLEWLAAGLGLVLTLTMLGILIWQMWIEPEEQLPLVSVRMTTHEASGSLHVVGIVAYNARAATAANVVIEGTLLQGGQVVESAQLSLDYVPGHSSRHGGLFFTRDPRNHELKIRALGYADP
ncbi:hypothetical protein T8T21_17595 (plasmid) [Limimaricola variabilis]|uniref:hypothetical protein n=1 Tax=Limimaricola variabilis TaxID=1492771 RepID=UPI002AC8FA06|nr:hypothetical protein [Limimaricola variabilis]WPY96563.1 hypothetical protein T8T21_17595 [Limimaricola variabilis]